MARDPAPSLYLGRPCYHAASPCDPRAWTLERYSEQVVDSLVQALRQLATPEQPLALIGYSGGGTLALLMAERLPRVVAVVTVAGNLDPDAWTALHDFTPFSGSENPAHRPPLPARVRELHFAGERDRVVPADLVREAAARRPGAIVEVVPGASHAEGWEAFWPTALERLEQALARSP